MEFAKNPCIKVYSRGSSYSGSSPRTRILTQLESDGEDEDLGKANPMSKRIEQDLCWASKYLRSDRSSSLPRHQNKGSAASSSTEDLKAHSPGPGRHWEDSMTFGSQSRRSISPMTYREDGEESSRSVCYSRASASPLSSRKDFSSRNGLLGVRAGLPPSGCVSPDMSHPVTRTYNDLDLLLLPRGNPRAKKPISETRKKLRRILCRSRNDPHYFDADD